MTADEIAAAVLARLKAEGYIIIPPCANLPVTAHAIAGAMPDWTPEEEDLVRQLWPNVQIPTEEICSHVGRSLMAIKRKAIRLGVKRIWPRSEPPKEKPKDDAVSFWTEQRDAELRRLLAEGNSARDCAAIFGVTRNSVIGRSHRLDIRSSAPSNSRPKKSKETPKPKAATILAPGVPMPQPQVSHRVELVFGDETIELKPAGSGAAEAVMALRRDSCRWPNGDPLGDDFNFCGCKALIGRPYCETHYRLSFGLGTLAERKSVGAARKVLA
jgi:GcrA cell cycle regulator